MKKTQNALRLAIAGSLVGMASAAIVVSEPFDYNVGLHTQDGDNKWATQMGTGSGTGWENIWFGHGADRNFGISTGGHTGTFADSTGMNNVSTNQRSRYIDPAVNSNSDGAAIWQYLTVSITGTGTMGQLATETRSGHGQFAVRVEADGTYTLAGAHGFGITDTSTIAASQDETSPDIILVKFHNQTDAGSDLVDISMWVNPSALTEAELPAPDLQLIGVTPGNGRTIGGITWRPGTMQIDNFKLATVYEDLDIGVVIEGPIIGVKNGPTTLGDGISTVNFGASVTGIAVNRTLTISNDGAATLNLGAITIDGADAAEFSVGTPGSSALAPGATTTVTVTYTPTDYGAASAALHIANDSEGDLASFDIALAGTGQPPIVVTEGTNVYEDGNSVNFIGILDTSIVKTITISNGGLDPLTLGAITVDGADAANFTVGALGATTLNTGESTTFTVTFTASDDTLKDASLHIANSSAGDANPFDLVLSGYAHVAGSTILVTEPFDYDIGLLTQDGDNKWTTSMGSDSGTGWGTNVWFGHVAGMNFGIASGGHTGTFADSTGMSHLGTKQRTRRMSPAVHSNDDGAVTWQHLTVSSNGTGAMGQLATEGSNGYGRFSVRLAANGTYTLTAQHNDVKTATSTIAASQNPNAPDTIVVKMVNQTNATSNLYDVSMWVNPTAATEGELPAPDLHITGAEQGGGGRVIDAITWMPGSMQIDNFILAEDYADFLITAPTGGYSDWAGANAGGQDADGDYDNDGVSNGVEFFMGETGSTFTSNPGIDANNQVTWNKDAAFSGTYEVQVSYNLEDWTAVPVEAVTDNGTSVVCDVSELTPVDGKIFIRLMVTPE